MTREECVRILSALIETNDEGQPGAQAFPCTVEIYSEDVSGEEVMEAITEAVALLTPEVTE